MLLPADTPPAVTDALGYLQHHLQELTEHQNALEHTINATLVGLTAQLQQLTQLITAPAPTVAPPLIPTFPPPVSPPSPVPATLSKQQTRPKLPSPPDFSGEWSSGRAFLNSCMLYLRLAPEQFTCDKEKIFWTLTFFKDRCKGISLEVCLVTWVGSHLRAVVSPIAFSLSPVFPSVTIHVNPLNLL